MGIHGLMKLLSEECPEAIKEQELENYTGRKVAIDASMAMYQFLVAVRMGPGGGQSSSMLMNEAGEVTSHIQGMFNRTIKMMTSGIRPAYVFDGKPPEMKSGELAKRLARREKAEADLAVARAAEAADDVDKFSRRLVKVTRQHNADCQELLRLMGIPVVLAPGEAEAQCAEMAKHGKVYATATEDMDALTFRTPKLLRKLTFSQSSKDKQPILEIDFNMVLQGMDITYEQFVDLCILCGCDYCSTIKGIGPKTALKLIRVHKNIETVIKALKREKKYSIPVDWFPQKVPKLQDDVTKETSEQIDETISVPAQIEASVVPARTSETESIVVDKPAVDGDVDVDEIVLQDSDVEDEGELSADLLLTSVGVDEKETVDDEEEEEEEDFSKVNLDEFEIIPPLYAQARELFFKCDVQDGSTMDLKWAEPDEAGLKTFLIDRMGFNEERVVNGIKRLKEAQLQKAQKRMDSFFTAIPSATAGVKRKVEEPKGKKPVPKKSGGARRR
jgi:flap endonuclease-1